MELIKNIASAFILFSGLGAFAILLIGLAAWKTGIILF